MVFLLLSIVLHEVSDSPAGDLVVPIATAGSLLPVWALPGADAGDPEPRRAPEPDRLIRGTTTSQFRASRSCPSRSHCRGPSGPPGRRVRVSTTSASS